MKKQIELLQKQIEMLKNRLDTMAAQPAPAPAAVPAGSVGGHEFLEPQALATT